MDNDRELLEAAARAAYITPILCYETKRNCLRIGDRNTYYLWRPLTDDGDAMRLRNKLSLEIYDGDDDGPAVFVRLLRRNQVPLYVKEMHRSDPNAATRRAIVRVAAEIGKGILLKDEGK